MVASAAMQRERHAGLLHHLPAGLAAAAVVVTAVAVLAGGGSGTSALPWVGVPALLLAATVAAAGAVGIVPLRSPGRAGLALLLLLAAYALWSGVTIAWSVAPDRSWDAVNRTLVYLAFLALGVVAGSLVRAAPRAAAAALAGILGWTLVWSLAGRVIPALGPDVDRSARLVGPLEYWNALALALALAVPLWLWFASDRGQRPAVRALAVVALAWTVVALLLTGSRGGLLVVVVAAAVWMLLAPRRLEGAAALAVALPVGGAVGVWALSREGLARAGAEAGTRAADGALLGLLLVVAGAAAAALALALVRREEEAPLPAERRHALGRAAVLAAAACALALVAVVVVRAGGPAEMADRFRNPPEVQLPNDPSRYVEVASNHRWTWWGDAWDIFERHRLGGAGAGAYEVARRPIRSDARSPIDPHTLPLKALSETGLVGFLLLLAAVVAAAAVAACALRRLAGGHRAAAAALAAGAAAWLVHSLLDMTWELAAVTAPVLLGLGVLAVSGRAVRSPGPRRPLLAVAAPAAALAAAFSLVSPALADRRLDAALAALVFGETDEAIELARDARELNPLSVAPLHMEATALEATGRDDEAAELYERAVELQPQNAVTWFELGRFEYEARGNLRRALHYLDRSWGLDPWAPETGRLLDAVRAELAAR